MSERTDCGADAAAYVLGALETDEASAFRRHLADCAVCRDEVATLQGVVDALPMAAPQVPAPASLKRRIMTDVRADAKRRRVATGGRFRLSRMSSPLLGRPALAVGGVLAAVAVAFGIVELSASGSGSRTVQASVSGGMGTAVLRLSGGHAELAVSHMPAPPPGRIYEVWLQRDGHGPAPTSALFSVTAAGAGTVDVPGNLNGVRTVMVTAEPLGGSNVPSQPPVIVAHPS